MLQAVLRTVPLPAAQGVVVLPFVGLSDAAAFVPELLGSVSGASSCDLFDRRSISLARDADASCRGWIDEAAEAIFIVEFEGDDPEQVAAKVRLLGERAIRTRALVAEPFSTLKRVECERLLGLRRLLEPLLMRFRGRARPVSFIDDVAVPPDRLARSCRDCRAFFSNTTSHGRSMPMPARAGCDCGRFWIWQIPATGPSSNRWLPGLRHRHRGRRNDLELSGCGCVRTQFLRKQYGELVQVFREIKDAFDPQNQLNPGKVIGDDPHLMLRDLKPWPESPAEAITEPSSILSWSGTSPADAERQRRDQGRTERQATACHSGRNREFGELDPAPAASSR